MSDIPALFAQTLVIFCGVRALEDADHSERWLAAAAATGLFAFAIREYSLIAVAAVVLLVAFVRRQQARPIWRAIAMASAFVVVSAALWRWRHALPHDQPVAFQRQSGREVVTAACQVLLTTAFLVVPASLVISPARLMRAARRTSTSWTVIAVGLVAASAAIGLRLTNGNVFIGNYLMRDGTYTGGVAGSAGGFLPRLPFAVWCLVIGAAVWSLLVLVLVTVIVGVEGIRRIRDGRPKNSPPPVQRSIEMLLFLYVVMCAAAFLLVVATTALFFDRYMLMIVVPLAGLVLVAAARLDLVSSASRLRYAGLIIAAYSVFGLGVVDASAAFDGARWQLGEQAVARGAAPQTVDAGFEWYSFHTDKFVDLTQAPLVPGRNWWVARFPSADVCQTVTIAPPPNTAGLPHTEIRSLYGTLTFWLTSGPDRC
jgi:hypothetical protein